MHISLPQTLAEWVALLGGCCGLIALLWNIAKWAINRGRLSRQRVLQIKNLEKLKHDKMLDWTEKRNNMLAEIPVEQKRVAAEVAASGIRHSGCAVQKLRDFEESVRKRIISLTRNHEAELREIDLKISEIENKPIS